MLKGREKNQPRILYHRNLSCKNKGEKKKSTSDIDKDIGWKNLDAADPYYKKYQRESFQKKGNIPGDNLDLYKEKENTRNGNNLGR